jgi:hypothetical protein
MTETSLKNKDQSAFILLFSLIFLKCFSCVLIDKNYILTYSIPMRVDRKTITKTNKYDEEKPVHLSKAAALSFVWELTEELFYLSGRYDVKSRLQRNVVTITRKQS